MQDFFERSISELDQVEGLRGRFNLVNPSGFTCTVINQMRQRQAHITVRTSGDGGGMGDIYYSFNERAPENTANGWFSIESDDYDLFLAWNNFAGGNDRERLSPRQAAEALWAEFVRLAGIEYE